MHTAPNSVILQVYFSIPYKPQGTTIQKGTTFFDFDEYNIYLYKLPNNVIQPTHEIGTNAQWAQVFQSNS